jgi:hypothetical protein
VVDLRTAIALGYAGREAQRDRLLEWVTAQTRANYDIMGELYCRGEEDCPQRGDYRGSVPMIGFGPGAYILALTEREGGDVAPDPCADFAPSDTVESGDAGSTSDADDVGQPGPTGSPTSSDGGCQCTATPHPKGDTATLFLLVALLFVRARFIALRS